MIFSSYVFLFLFLPITFGGYFILNRLRLQVIAKWWLVLASFFFYAYGNVSFLSIFVGSIFFNYFVGITLGNLHQKELNLKINLRKTRLFWLLLGVLVDLFILGYFKYYNFVVENINFLFSSQFDIVKLALPLGISFFIFQKVAYLVDSFRGLTKEFTLVNFMLFVSFFPQLIVGPIVHHHDIIPQFTNVRKSKINYNNIAKALFLLALGFSKKLLIADPLTSYAQVAFANFSHLSMLESWGAGLSYTISYYFDLSGYADMAIALGLMFNITLPINFNSPYKARDFADYWRRWHMSLSRFLGDYIFKNIFKKGDSSMKFYLAVMVTFLVSGIWHGAGWNFVVWGILNGLFVASSHAMKRNNKELPFLLAWSLTFLGVIITRILFVSTSISNAFTVVLSLFDFSSFRIYDLIYLRPLQVGYIVIGLIITLFFPNSMEVLKDFKPNLKFLLFTLILMIVSISKMGEVKSFLYFQF